jgi:hypothetical protein
VSVKSLRNDANDGLWVPTKALLGTPGSLAFEWMQRRWRAEATGGIFASSRKEKWKSRLTRCRPECGVLRQMHFPHRPRPDPARKSHCLVRNQASIQLSQV